MRTNTNRGIAWLVLALAAAATTGCADPSQSLFPTAPSGLISPSPAFRPGGPAFSPFTIGTHGSDAAAQ